MRSGCAGANPKNLLFEHYPSDDRELQDLPQP